jgi:hypothetical protein
MPLLLEQLFDIAEVRVGQSYHELNTQPGVERAELVFTPDLFHVANYACHAGDVVIEAFLHAPIQYGLSEPVPGITFFVYDIGGAGNWVVDLGLTLESLPDEGRRCWLDQQTKLIIRESGQVKLALTLICAHTNKVLAVRDVMAPVELALEARYLMERQQNLAPGSIAGDVQRAMQAMYSPASLMAQSATIHLQESASGGSYYC